MERRCALLATASTQGASGGGGQFYVYCEGSMYSYNYTFTIDSQKTWEECVGLKDDTGVAEILPYEEVVPGSGLYRFYIYVDLFFRYAVEADEDWNVPTPEDKIKINTTYTAFEA
jgi:hypothetical protein